MSIRERILASNDRVWKRIEAKELPLWGVDVFVCSMTAGEREAFERRYVDTKGEAAVAYVVSRFTFDEQEGARTFNDGDVAALSTKHKGHLWRVYNTVIELSEITEKSVDVAEKN